MSVAGLVLNTHSAEHRVQKKVELMSIILLLKVIFLIAEILPSKFYLCKETSEIFVLFMFNILCTVSL